MPANAEFPGVDTNVKKVDEFCSIFSRLYGQIPEFMGRTDFMGKPALRQTVATLGFGSSPISRWHFKS
jgi:hypothetical protein